MRIGSSIVYCRGFDQASQLSPSYLREGDGLHLCPEPTNWYDWNAVLVVTRDNEHVGRITRDHSRGCASVLRDASSLGVRIRTYFVRFEEEEVIKQNGVKYTGQQIVIALKFYGKIETTAALTSKLDEVGLSFILT